MRANNTISINGKLYDARTGELVNKTKPATVSKPSKSVSSTQKSQSNLKPTTKSQPPKRGNGFVDGIAKNPKAPAKSIKKTDSKPKPKSSISHNVSPVHRKLKHSPTLNRSGVKSPKLTVPEAKKHVSAKMKSSKPPVQRLERAKSTKKSELITRFAHHGVVINSHSQKSPETQNRPSHDTAINSHSKSVNGSKGSHISSNTKHRLINESLTVASNTHKKEKVHKVKHSPKIFHFMTAGLATIILLGYVTYLNVPSVSIKVASSRAGFSASLPSQSPAGYRLQGPIGYKPGQVVIKFNSNTDERHFTITQQPTTWDSVALKENLVDKKGMSETYNDRGLTVYIYGGGDAAWVDAGKFYSVKSENSQLDASQILDLATSM